MIDVCFRIPRDEVEEMRRVVMRELDEVQPGCVSTIVGGYVTTTTSCRLSED